jgi:hypothetical protein
MRKAFVVLIASTLLLTLFNIPKVGIAQTPFRMPYKTFQLEVLHGQSAIVYYQGTMYLNLTLTTELPMGTLYDSARKVVYMVIYTTYSNPDLVWGIAEINITDFSYKIYRFPWYIDGIFYGPVPWTIAEDENGELWVSIRSYLGTPEHSPELRPYLAKLNITSNTLTIYYIPGGSSNDIKFHNGYIWYLTYPFLKINATSEEIVATYPYFFDGFMEPDGDYIWITSVSSGLVTKFNTVTGTFDLNLTGFDRPLGIEATADAVYVAENGALDTIAVINKATLQITRIHTGASVTNQGPYYVLKDSFGNLWWTDNSQHFGVITKYGVKINYQSISAFNYFISELPGNTVLFSCKGSALAGIMSQPKSPDVNNDGIVNMRDITAIILDFNAVQGEERYKPECDLDNNGIVNMRDVTIAILCFNKRTS